MKRILSIVAVLAMFTVSCTPPVDKPDDETVTPGPVVKPGPEPEKPKEHKYTDVALHSAFTQTFDSKDYSVFTPNIKEDTPDLRYYPAFPSWNEKGTSLLMLRMDPKDPSGMNQAIAINSNEHCFYGSYSVRMRLPNIKAVQPNIGVNVIFTLNELDDKNGYSTIELMQKMADPATLILSSTKGTERNTEKVKDPVSSFKPCEAYYTYGFDWHADKIIWWIKGSADRQVILEQTECVPCFPSVLKYIIYHSKNNPAEANPNAIQAPYYPYEFEIDAISYEPFQEEIDAWHKENFPEE